MSRSLKSILWVEDERDQYEALSYPLREKYSLTNALNYVDAIQKINSSNFDLYIIDVILPSGKKSIEIGELTKISDIYFGIELIRKIRKQSNNTPIIVLSIVADRRIIEEIKKIDQNIIYLSKYDYDADEIIEIINRNI